MDIDDEPMTFNNEIVGTILLEIGKGLDDDWGDFVRAVGNAFLDRDEYHVVSLSQRKRGRFVSPTDSANRRHEVHNVTMAVMQFEVLGLQKKAAVSRVCEIYGRSRAWVFAALREQEEFDAAVRSIRATRGEERLRQIKAKTLVADESTQSEE
ncbi:hypothetical protein E2E30_17750 [Sphingomonas sp. AAP5]|uniref:hypothetical protein n=1 Tax=Sphingomonas sp. AAP5 TaxID=1523415 RepID=UPI0010571A11|nr:hypothetical protein [Sphingomonas sp. AAP5]QBM77406.1 hypothetical protein E2E30_17750 [Sphingomonas sp. AAP5]